MKKNLLYMLAAGMMGMAEAAERRHTEPAPPAPKITCKDCYFYTGGTFCKQVKHNVNKQTPANDCWHFKKG